MTNNSTPHIAVLLTCHNRVAKTLKCLQEVFSQAENAQLNIDVILVDDGSSDGTAEAIREKYLQVCLLMGDGNLFWNRGMHLAFGEALKQDSDYYLWLNDDTHLHPNAITTLLATHQQLMTAGKGDSIVIPSTRDPRTGQFSYGGYRLQRTFLNPLKLDLVPASEQLQACETFCGNCVLIPRQVAQKVGNINPVYLHRWGDVDYGLRALEKGCKTWIVPGYLADCEANPLADRWRHPDLPLKEKIRELHSLKGVGKEDWLKYVRRHGGFFWLLIYIKPYVRILFDTALGIPKRIFR